MSGDPEVLTIGRISADLYGQEAGAGLADPQTFAKAVGGSPTNVAVALARLGRRAAVLTKVGDDAIGTFCIRDLEALGVDTRWVGRQAGGRTPVVLAGLADPAEPEFVFYRDALAPDLTITPEDLADDVASSVPVLWFTGSALSREPSAGTVRHALQVRDRRPHVVFDLDYRSSFWPDRATAEAAFADALPLSTIAIGNRDECSVATGLPADAGADALADALLARGPQLAVVKQGADGVLVATPQERTVVPGIRIEVVCGLGAGDAFGGAFVHGLLSGWDPATCVRYGNAAGAIVASRLLCSHAMPTDAEIRDVLDRDVLERTGATHDR